MGEPIQIGELDARCAKAGAVQPTLTPEESAAHLESPDSAEYRLSLDRILAARHQFAQTIPHFEKAVKLSGGVELQSLEMPAAMLCRGRAICRRRTDRRPGARNCDAG